MSSDRHAIQVRENRARSIAAKRGIRLTRCRVRDQLAIGFGLYCLASAETADRPRNRDFPLTLPDVEMALGLVAATGQRVAS